MYLLCLSDSSKLQSPKAISKNSEIIEGQSTFRSLSSRPLSFLQTQLFLYFSSFFSISFLYIQFRTHSHTHTACRTLHGQNWKPPPPQQPQRHLNGTSERNQNSMSNDSVNSIIFSSKKKKNGESEEGKN